MVFVYVLRYGILKRGRRWDVVWWRFFLEEIVFVLLFYSPHLSEVIDFG